jgi:hypothetical protein
VESPTDRRDRPLREGRLDVRSAEPDQPPDLQERYAPLANQPAHDVAFARTEQSGINTYGATAINAVAANGWPKGSRGDLDIERATSYIRVPKNGANEICLQAALHLRDHLEPLLNRLADPSHWT